MVDRGALRLYIALIVQICGFLLNLTALVIFYLYKAYHFFIPLFLVWLADTSRNTYFAFRDFRRPIHGDNANDAPEQITIKSVLVFLARFPFLALCQGAQVQHILRTYRKQAEQSQVTRELTEPLVNQSDEFSGLPTLFGVRLFDGVIVKFVFAFLELYAMFLMDGEYSTCSFVAPDHLVQGILSDQEAALARHLVRIILGTAGCFSLAAIALSAVEVDFRLDSRVNGKISESSLDAVLQILHRLCQAGFRMGLLVLFSLLIRDNGLLWQWGHGITAIVLPNVIMWMLNVLMIPETNSSNFLAHVFIGFVALVVNPFEYIDANGYRKKSWGAARRLKMVPVFQFCLVAIFVVVPFVRDTVHMGPPKLKLLQSACEVKGVLFKTEFEYVWTYQTGIVEWLSCFTLLHLVFTLRMRNAYPLEGRKKDEDLHAVTMQVEPGKKSVIAAPLDLATVVLRAGYGITLRKDFEIVDKIGEGMYGVVVKAQQSSMFGVGRGKKEFALKLQHRVDDASGEVKVMLTIDHPFAVKLVHYWHVEGQTFKYKEPQTPQPGQSEDKQTVRTKKGGSDFAYAIMMESVPQSLEKFIAFSKKIRKEDPSELDKSVKEMRILGAELADVLKYLHEHCIVYRDLKPDNALVRGSDASNRHICLIDFGMAKIDEEGKGEFMSEKGNDLASPEMYRNFQLSQANKPKKGVTYAVDVWAYGVTFTMMLMAWDFSDIRVYSHGFQEPFGLNIEKKEGRKNPLLPELQKSVRAKHVPRLCNEAFELLKKVLNRDDPQARGTMAEVCDHPFFKAIQDPKQSKLLYEPVDIVQRRAAAEAKRS